MSGRWTLPAKHRVWLASLAARAGVVSGGALAGAPADSAPFPAATAGGEPALAILQSEATKESRRVAATFGQSDFARRARVVPGRPRGGASGESGRVFAAPSDHGWLCVLLEHPAFGYVPASSCQAVAHLFEQPLTLAIPSPGGWIVAGLAPDGYTEAAAEDGSAPITGNGFIREDVADDAAIQAIGPHLPQLASGKPRP